MILEPWNRRNEPAALCLKLAALPVTVTKFLKQVIVCSGSQFKGTDHHGKEVAWQKLEVAGDMAATVRRQRDGWVLLLIFPWFFVCFPSRILAHMLAAHI